MRPLRSQCNPSPDSAYRPRRRGLPPRAGAMRARFTRTWFQGSPCVITHSRFSRGTRLMLLAVVTLTGAGRAHADDFIVYSPHVIATQTEIELRGYNFGDGRSDMDG